MGPNIKFTEIRTCPQMTGINNCIIIFLHLLYPCVIEAICLKTIKIELSFAPIPDRKGFLEVDMNAFIQYSTLLVMT